MIFLKDLNKTARFNTTLPANFLPHIVSDRLDRFEMKFVINAAQRESLMTKLGPHLCADGNADETAYYPIVSLYYDSPERDCYWEKIRGISNRRKFRVRVYGSMDGNQRLLRSR